MSLPYGVKRQNLMSQPEKIRPACSHYSARKLLHRAKAERGWSSAETARLGREMTLSYFLEFRILRIDLVHQFVLQGPGNRQALGV